MRWGSIVRAWNRAFFEPQMPAPLGLFRILFGLLVIAKLVLFYPDWLQWFGVHAWVTPDTMHKMEGGLRINLFDVLPQADAWIWTFFFVALAAAVCLSFGFLTRVSSVLVFFALVSMDERELYAMNSGDTFLRVAAFFLMFAPAEAAFSIDRLIAIWRGKETPEHKPQVVWTQRMIQFQTALVYFMTAWWKATGETWVNGTALYYVQHLQEFHRFPMPSWTNNPLIIKVQTWFGLAEEFALGTLIWIVEVRYWVLAAGVVLHLALEYSMNVPLFQWIMMSTFVLFVDPADLYSFWTFICQRVVTSEIQLIYDATDFDARRKVNIIRSLDIFRKISFLVERSGSWCVTRPEGNVYGVEALGELATVIPVLWVLRPFFRNKKRRKCVSSTGTAK